MSVRNYILGIVMTAMGVFLFSTLSYASSEAGIDVSSGPMQVRVLYSVASDDDDASEPIRNPNDLLFEIIALLQRHSVDKNEPHVVLQFELYQSSIKPGNYLSLVQDPFEDGHYKELYDGLASKDLTRQVISLLEQHLNIQAGNRHPKDVIRLYKCTDKQACKDILFGSFPSVDMHTGYCMGPAAGCDAAPISVRRESMRNYFHPIP